MYSRGITATSGTRPAAEHYNLPMPIRPATIDDAEAIASIYNDAIEKTTAVMYHLPQPAAHWVAQLADRKPRHIFLVNEDETGGVVGFAALNPFDPRCGYDDIADLAVYIAEDHRGHGLGRALMRALIDAGREAGVHSVLARITTDNAASIFLHESLGFALVGTYKQLGKKFGKRHDVSEYQLILK